MRPQFRLSNLIPPELAVKDVSADGDAMIVNAGSIASSRPCPRWNSLKPRP